MGNKKYRVKLTAEEREQLEGMLRKGRGSAQHLLKARILLKADEGESGEHWSDGRICEALSTYPVRVELVRKQLALEREWQRCLRARSATFRRWLRFLTERRRRS